MMNLFKDFKYKLGRESRRRIKYKVLLYAVDILRVCNEMRLGDHVTPDMIEESVHTFTERCNRQLSSNPTRGRYIKTVITRSIIPIIRFVFSLQRRRMAQAETLDILSNYTTQAPRFFYSNRIDHADFVLAGIEKNIILIVCG
jgi:hypothetical protein